MGFGWLTSGRVMVMRLLLFLAAWEGALGKSVSNAQAVSARKVSMAATAALMAVVALAAGGAKAHASGFGGAVTAPSVPLAYEDPRSIDVQVVGEIPSRCELGAGRDLDFGELTGGIRIEVGFGLVCNVPFELTVRAARGGLTHVSQPAGQGGFSGRLGYGLAVDVPVIEPRERMMSGRYESRDLVGGVTLSSGDAIAKGGGSLRFETRSPEGLGLLAGAYTETVHLTLAPRM